MREIEEWPSTLISEWLAYDQLDRIPDPWWIGAQLCQVMATVMQFGSRKRFSVEDFIPREREVRIVSGEEGVAMMEMIIAVQTAKANVNRCQQGEVNA